MEPAISLALVDDEPAFLFEMSQKLQALGFNTRSYREAATLLADINRGQRFSCIAADVRMPGMTGLDLQRDLVRLALPVPLILFTGFSDIDIAVSAMKAGAADFLGKPIDVDRLAGSIRNAIAEARRRDKERAESAEVAARVAELGDRHLQVLNLMVQGLTSKQIAAAMSINHRTIENYRAHVMEHIGVSNIAQLVRVMMRLEASQPGQVSPKKDG